MSHKTAAPRITAFHGSSIRNLKSILAQGLIPVVKERNWQSDDAAGMHAPSRESYSGTYITTNLMTAMSSPRDKLSEGSVIVVAMTLQPNSMYLDEDDINSVLNSPLQHISDSSYHAIRYYLMATLSGGTAKYKGDLEDVQDKYISTCLELWSRKLEKRTGKPMDPSLEKRLVELLPGMWLAALTRLAAHGAAQKNSMRSFRSIYSEVTDADYESIPPVEEVIPTPLEGERVFREKSDQITRTLRLMAHPDPNTVWNTARVNEPIGYSGSNRILAVLEIRDSRKYRGEDWKKPVPIIVHYGNVPQEFWAQWKERIGSEVEVTKQDGRAAPEVKAASLGLPADVQRIANRFCDATTEQERTQYSAEFWDVLMI